MSYTTEDWEYYLGRAYDTLDKVSEDENIANKMDNLAEGLMNLCEHLNVVQKEYLNNLKSSKKE